MGCCIVKFETTIGHVGCWKRKRKSCLCKVANHIQILGEIKFAETAPVAISRSRSRSRSCFTHHRHLSVFHFYTKLPLVRAHTGQKKEAEQRYHNLAHPVQLYLEQSRSDAGDSSLFFKHTLKCKRAPECSQGVSVVVQTAVWSRAAWFSCWHLLIPFCVTEQLKTGALR